MPKLILHHHASSPFSEKIRALLGYLELESLSVETTAIMPRPLRTGFALESRAPGQEVA